MTTDQEKVTLPASEAMGKSTFKIDAEILSISLTQDSTTGLQDYQATLRVMEIASRSSLIQPIHNGDTLTCLWPGYSPGKMNGDKKRIEAVIKELPGHLPPHNLIIQSCHFK